MQLPDEVASDLDRRLRRIEGQVRGVRQMLSGGRECRDVVAQVSAATRALEQVGFRLLVTGLTACLDDPDMAAENGFDLDEVEKLFRKLA